MSLTASTLISDAKQRAFGSVGPQKISNAMLLSELTYQDQLLSQMTSQIAPDLLATVTGSIDPLSDASNASGYTLSAGIHYRDFVHEDTTDDEYTPITLVQRQFRDSPVDHPAGMLNLSGNQGVFYPIDPEGERWTTSGDREWFEANEGHTVSYSYVPAPSRITSMSATLTAPDMAREVIVSSLVLEILMAAKPMDQARVEATLAKRQGALDSFRMQLYKFAHPQGSRPGARRELTDTGWVFKNVDGS